MEYEYKLQVIKPPPPTNLVLKEPLVCHQACKDCGQVDRTGLCKAVTSSLTPRPLKKRKKEKKKKNTAQLKVALNETKLTKLMFSSINSSTHRCIVSLPQHTPSPGRPVQEHTSH